MHSQTGVTSSSQVSSTQVPYLLVPSTAHLRNLVHGRRKAIEVSLFISCHSLSSAHLSYVWSLYDHFGVLDWYTPISSFVLVCHVDR